MSVVTSPACASTGGSVVKRKVAIRPAIGPPVRLPHRKTISAGQQEERQNARPRQRQHAVVVGVVAQHGDAIGVAIAGVTPALAGQPGTEGAHGARHGRVRGIAGDGAVIEPFHARAEMNGLVHGVAQHGVGGRDAQRRNQHQNRA